MKKILVAVDGSPRRAGVLQAGRRLAEATGAKVVLFRAITLPTEPPPEAYRVPPGDYTRALEERARDELDKSIREIGHDRVLSTRIEVGTAWYEICRIAKEEDVDMIVLGSHGYDMIDRILGTTAAKVVNHADRTVVVVRAAERLSAE